MFLSRICRNKREWSTRSNALLASYPGVQKAEGTPGTHCLRMRLICYWAIALWTLVTSTYGLGFVDDVLASYYTKKCEPKYLAVVTMASVSSTRSV